MIATPAAHQYNETRDEVIRRSRAITRMAPMRVAAVQENDPSNHHIEYQDEDEFEDELFGSDDEDISDLDEDSDYDD